MTKIFLSAFSFRMFTLTKVSFVCVIVVDDDVVFFIEIESFPSYDNGDNFYF